MNLENIHLCVLVWLNMLGRVKAKAKVELTQPDNVVRVWKIPACMHLNQTQARTGALYLLHCSPPWAFTWKANRINA